MPGPSPSKGRKAEDILRKILKKRGLKAEVMRFDLLGVNALHLNTAGEPDYAPNEVVLRVAIRTNDKGRGGQARPGNRSVQSQWSARQLLLRGTAQTH